MRDDLNRLYGDWCLVVGAAEGLGEAYSTSLAKQGLNLIMVDLQQDKLDSLARKLEASFGIQTNPLIIDLVSADSVKIMMEAIRKTDCRLMIYNAAFSRVMNFQDNDPDMLDRYIEVNTRIPIQLIHAFCQFHAGSPEYKKGILLMSSLAGSWGTNLLAPYGASKAFNHILAESLHYELKGEGFDVLACIAGATSTPAYLASLPPGRAKNRSTMTPEAVVNSALKALGKRPFVIPGFRNKLTYFILTRILPRRTSLRIMNHAVGGMYREN